MRLVCLLGLLLAAVAAPSLAAPGLTGSYYNNTSLTAPAALTRVDSTVNFNWGSAAPGTGVNADNFSVRWAGVVRVQTTGTYTFQTSSDDGVRLWVNGSQLINNWTVHTATTDTSTGISLTAGVDYTITLEYYENTGNASIVLSWKKPGDSVYSVVPASNGTLGLATVAGTTLLAAYSFEETGYAGNASELQDSAGYSAGPYNGKAQGVALPTAVATSPARSGSTGTCGYANLPGPAANGGDFAVTGLPVSTTSGDQTTVAFWMYWTGTDQVVPVGWNFYALAFASGYIGFNTGNNDLYGTSSTGLLNGWHHIVTVFSNGGVTGNQLYIDGAPKTLSQIFGWPTNSNAVVTSTLNIGGASPTTGNRFIGRLDEVRVYYGRATSAEVATLYAETHPCGGSLVASYDFEEPSYNGTAGELKDGAGAGGGPYNGNAQGSPLASPLNTSPARSGSTGTCGYASLPGPVANGGNFVVTGLPLSASTGAQTTLAFWLYWGGSYGGMPVSLGKYNLIFYGTSFGFNTDNSDVYGVAASSLSGSWHHVVAVFTNGSVGTNQLYIDGAAQTLTQRSGSPITANAAVGSSLRVGGYSPSTNFRFAGLVDQVRVYSGASSAAQVAALYAETHACPVLLDHIEIQHGSGSGLTCTPSTITVKACQDAACSTAYTGGLSGTLTSTGSGMTVVWPSGAAFSITAGASSTTNSLQVTSPGSVLLGSSGLSVTPSGSNTCNFGSPLCTFTAADAGLLFDVPNHRAEASNTVTVTAVKKADNSAACTPAFASVSKAVTFKCSYTNPTSGTLPVRVGGAALNSGNSSSAACDASGQAVTLAFNTSGVASTTVLYADVGKVLLTGTYTGSGSGVAGDAGLVMAGSDSFTAAPYDFAVSGISASAIAAGSSFSASVSARNSAGNTAPNFGRETAAEGVTLGFVRAQPTGSGASNGVFSGSTGAWAGGLASASNLGWSEVGRGDVSAVLASGSYLASGMTAAGSSAGALVGCATENGTCTLPTGGTATVYYGALGKVAVVAGLSGAVWCANGNFGDPYPGYGKSCSYAVTSGAAPGAAGSGLFKPHHFDVATTPACGAFSYAGQPFTATLTARNASNATTVNYDGTANTTPTFAKATTLSEPSALGVGTLAGTSVAATAYTAGLASTASPSYSFTTKTTSNRTLGLRAIDTDSVSSAGYAEGSMPLRSGRLRLSNAFGSASAALQIPVVAEYWSGNTWVLNSADSCSTLAASNVALSNPRGASGAASTAGSSAGGLVISSGSGVISLAAPTPAGSSLSLDLALNLGATTADQSCQANHPASTGAAKPWLRAQMGSCASTADRDPAARASFGIFSPETKKTVHVREVF